MKLSSMLAPVESTTEQDEDTCINTNTLNTEVSYEASMQTLDIVEESKFKVESDNNDNESLVLSGTMGPNRAIRKTKKCSKCSLALAVGCTNRCCKKCCLESEEPCEFHRQKSITTKSKEENQPSSTGRGRKSKQKVVLPEEPVVRVQRKPVLKNEYKEPNIMYYHETVTVFCVKDFFNAPKLSQGILNDQSRSLRVNGFYDGEHATRTMKRKKNPEWQAKLQDLIPKKIKTTAA